MVEYKFHVTMKNGSRKTLTRKQRTRLSDSMLKPPMRIEIDGAAFWISVQKMWSNGSVDAVEVDPVGAGRVV